ncbi:hypothetical protein CR513_06559, partial [Mucuna pruriens]
MKESKIEERIRCSITGSSSFVPGSLPIFDGKLFDNWRVKILAVFGFQDVIKVIFNKISNASTSKEAWEILVKTYGGGEKNKKVKLQTLRRQNIEDLPPKFDYVAAAIEESKDLDTMEVKELQHSLEAHEMRIHKRKVLKEQVFQAQTNYKGKGKGPCKGNKSSTNQKHQNQEFGETSQSSKERRTDQAQKQICSSKNSKEWKECWAGEGAKNKPNNCAHLTQDEGKNSDSEVVVLLAITSNEAQLRRSIEEEKELVATPVFNKASTKLNLLSLKKIVIEEKWLKAMKEEINSIKKNQTWELVNSPSNRKPIALKWVYKVKVNPRGEAVKNKAKLVAKDFLQKARIDYGEVYAPVAKIETIRLIVAIAINLDVKYAFLNGPLEEEVYVNQSLGFVVKGKENKVYKLKKTLYGLKQAPKAWNKRIDGCLSQIDFKKCTSEHGVYSNPVGTPAEIGLNLKKETDEEQVDPTHYRRIVGCLSCKENIEGKAATKPKLVGYSDLDWCGDKQDRKSNVGYIFFYGGAPISWSSTKEPVVPLSSCQVEYIATFETACQALWLDPLSRELQEKSSKKVKLLVDNKSTIDLARHLVSYGRSKHIKTRFHFLREQVNNEKLQIEHYKTEIQFTDIFIKALK